MKQLKRLGDRTLITIGKELRRDGIGKVYQTIETPNLAAKIYPPNKRTLARAEKLKLMISEPPENNHNYTREIDISIAWPVDLLVSNNNKEEIVGYLMPKSFPAQSIDRYYNWKSPRKRSLRLKEVYRSAINLAAAFQAIHAKGYVIGDVNQANILVKENGSIVIVNTDSFQVCNLAKDLIYYCGDSNPEFTPPELQRKNLAKIQRSPQQDLFGLAILIFKLLMQGIHPYDGVFLSTEDPLDRSLPIRLGHFPYNRKAKIPLYPQPEAPPFQYLHPQIQELFILCFEKGHSHPVARPTAITWQKALQQARDELLNCTKNPDHKYGNHLSNCPWCGSQSEKIPDLAPVDRSISPPIVKKNKKTYSSQKAISSPKITAKSPSSLPAPFKQPKYYKSSAKSWLTPRRKLTIVGLVAATPIVVWLFVAITIKYPLQFILTISLVALLLWFIFKSKYSR